MVPTNQIEKLSEAANNNLSLAKYLYETTDCYYNSICFNIQQYVEKKIKIKLIQENIKYKYSHDIGYLLQLLGITQLDDELSIGLDKISSFAVDIRYEPIAVSRKDVEKAFEIAEKIIELISKM